LGHEGISCHEEDAGSTRDMRSYPPPCLHLWPLYGPYVMSGFIVSHFLRPDPMAHSWRVFLIADSAFRSPTLFSCLPSYPSNSRISISVLIPNRVSTKS